jgi:anti-anti-sigma factor
MVDKLLGTVETEQLGDSLWVLKLAGEHDLTTAPAVAGAFRLIGETGTTVVVDFAETSFIDSTVIGALIKYADAGENLLLVAPITGTVRRLLDLVGVASRFQILETRAEALRAVPPEDQP